MAGAYLGAGPNVSGVISDARALEPITQGSVGEHTLVVGPSGSGKTTLVKYVARKLARQRLDFDWG